ncbi:MAG: type IV secretion system protein [Vicinamibacteraceae bacterium]
MPPANPSFSPVVAAQKAITTFLLAYEPQFLDFGHKLFLSLATVLLVWYGIRMMLTHEGLDDKMFHFAKLLMLLAFGYTMVFFYERPIPGIGVSFSNLITDQAIEFANIIDSRALLNIQNHLDELYRHFEEPDAWSITANLLYWLLLLIIGVTKFVAVAVVCFGFVASAVCALLGPIFVPFFVVPALDWLFWSWLRSFIQYSFIPVVAYAFLFIFERFIYQYLTTLPPYIPQDFYQVYMVQVFMVLLTFVLGVLLIPSLTASIFSGRSGESVLPGRFR